MGRLTADQAVALIQAAGFRCQRGYPGKRAPVIQTPAVAVNIQEDTGDGTTLAVYVFCPAEDGAQCCEDQALEVAGLLRENGAVCTQDHCTHDGRGDRFSVRILARWDDDPEDTPYSLSLNGTKRNYMTAFSARLEVELTEVGAMGQDEPAAVLRQEKGWHLTLTELFPPGTTLPQEPEEPFGLVLRRGTVGEVYDPCYWETVLQEDSAQGLLVTRTAKAWGREVLTYG